MPDPRTGIFPHPGGIRLLCRAGDRLPDGLADGLAARTVTAASRPATAGGVQCASALAGLVAELSARVRRRFMVSTPPVNVAVPGLLGAEAGAAPGSASTRPPDCGSETAPAACA